MYLSNCSRVLRMDGNERPHHQRRHNNQTRRRCPPAAGPGPAPPGPAASAPAAAGHPAPAGRPRSTSARRRTAAPGARASPRPPAPEAKEKRPNYLILKPKLCFEAFMKIAKIKRANSFPSKQERGKDEPRPPGIPTELAREINSECLPDGCAPATKLQIQDSLCGGKRKKYKICRSQFETCPLPTVLTKSISIAALGTVWLRQRERNSREN